MLGLSALVALRSHITIAADFGPYREGEYAHARSLWEHIPHRSLTLLDRGYASGALLYRLHSQGIHRHFLVRVPKTFHGSPEHILGSKDELVNWTLSAKARKAHPDLPERWTVRCIHYRHSDGSEGRLVTSLLDSEQYPAEELIKLYHERWEIELGYGEIKTDMLDQTHTPLRSHTPHGVRQEVWGILIAYHLIRWRMLRVAHRVHVSPLRISFLRVYRLICDEWLWCANAAPGTIPKYRSCKVFCV